MNDAVYFDYAASTPVDEQVVAAMHACLRSPVGTANPAASHSPGRAAAARIEQAGAEVAALIGADAQEIVWTSGATESDNLAIIGAARFQRRRGRHVVTAVTEHPAVLASCRSLEAEGFAISYLSPGDDGIVSPAQVEDAIRPDTCLVSLAHVNNELGVIQDVGAVGRICRQRDVLFHVDAAQSAGRMTIDVREQCIDLLSLSAHKMYGPKGAGVLFLDAQRSRRVQPLLHGGDQQRGLRPGTLPTHQIVGMGTAARLAKERLADEATSVQALRERLEAGLLQLPGLTLNGHPLRRSCHITNVTVTGVEGESLRCALRNFALASGSACASDSGEASPVLRSLGIPDYLAGSSLRISLGRQSSAAEVDALLAAVSAQLDRLRALAPA